MMPNCMKALLLIFIILFTTVYSDGKINLIPCKSHCRKALSSSSIFKDQVSMAKNLTRVAFKANNSSDIFNAMGFYSLEFKREHFLNLQAYRNMAQFKSAFTNAYGVDAVEEFKLARYGSARACVDCASDPNSVPEQGVYPIPNLYQEGSIDSTLSISDTLKDSALYMPISRIPYISLSNRRLLQPKQQKKQNPFSKFGTFIEQGGVKYAICLQNLNIYQQEQCFLQEITQQYEQLFHTVLSSDFFKQNPVVKPVKPVKPQKTRFPLIIPDANLLATDNVPQYEGLPEDSINGFANMNLYAKFGDTLSIMFDNCLAGNFRPIC